MEFIIVFLGILAIVFQPFALQWALGTVLGQELPSMSLNVWVAWTVFLAFGTYSRGSSK
jgi:hypothetical protein